MNIEDKKYKKSNPFATPEGYFENLHQRVMEHVLQQQEQSPKKGVAIWRKQFIGYAAAVLIIVAGLSIYNNPSASDKQSYMAAYESEQEMIEEFIENYPIDEYILYSYLTSTDTGF